MCMSARGPSRRDLRVEVVPGGRACAILVVGARHAAMANATTAVAVPAAGIIRTRLMLVMNYIAIGFEAGLTWHGHQYVRYFLGLDLRSTIWAAKEA